VKRSHDPQEDQHTVTQSSSRVAIEVGNPNAPSFVYIRVPLYLPHMSGNRLKQCLIFGDGIKSPDHVQSEDLDEIDNERDSITSEEKQKPSAYVQVFESMSTYFFEKRTYAMYCQIWSELFWSASQIYFPWKKSGYWSILRICVVSLSLLLYSLLLLCYISTR